MKKHKSLSNWMTSALSNPPPSSTPSLSTLPSSHPHTYTLTSSKKHSSLLPEPLPSKTHPRSQKSKQNTIKSSTEASVLDDGTDMPWSLKHKPDSAADLAVHKKKVSEVQQWLDFALSAAARHPMLLLVGPPGCGKTTTIHTLAKEMGCTILEWVNPVTDAGGSEADPQPGDLVVYTESQTKQFRSFLIRANRYPSLQVGGASGWGQHLEKKIVVVEEFPNAFLKDPSKFHNILNSVAPSLHYPLVFIVSESHRRDSSAHTLFSKSTQTDLDIHTISFNPVAHTTLVKTLQRIAASECNSRATKTKRNVRGSRDDVKFHLPPREVIEQLAESSVGDIRSAVNALQFTCLADSSTGGGVVEVKGQRNVKLKRSRSGSSVSTRMKRHASLTDGGVLAAIGGRDSSLFLFRALGKILYCKRDSGERGREEGERESGEKMESDGADSPPCLPEHLKQHERNRLLVNPESVIENSHLSSDMFTLYLHQNYLQLHTHTDDVVRASEYLSASDLVSSTWTDSQTTRALLQTSSSSLACRGIMHSHNPAHSPEGGGNKWRPLHKPQWISVNHKYCDNCRAARRLFLHLGQSPHAHLWTPVQLQTEILPHLALTNMPVRNPDQAALLQSITHFSQGYNRFLTENLGERDIENVDRTTSGDIGDPRLYSDDDGAGRRVGSVPSQGSGGSAFHTTSQDVGMGPVDSPEDNVEIDDFEDDLIW